MYSGLRVEKEGSIAYVTLDRPPLNLLGYAVFKELLEIAYQLERDKAVKAVVVRGSGSKAFCAGMDIGEMKDLTTEKAKEICAVAFEALRALETMSKPVIAALRGLVLGGGCELALACDFRLGDETVKIGQPEINLGIIPGAGGTQRLPRLVGLPAARRLLFLGEVIGAAEAERMGLLDRVVAAEKLEDEVRSLAVELAAKSSTALAALKRSLAFGAAGAGLDSGLLWEREQFLWSFAGRDREEGIKAFLERRRPVFQ